MSTRVVGCAPFLVMFLGLGNAAPAQRVPEPETKSDATSPKELPEAVASLTARSEAEEDRLASIAHYAQAKLLEPKRKHALALQHLQRAWRYGGEPNALLADIVPLAFEAKQSEAATRYAVLSAERQPKDLLLVRRLATYLTDKRDYARAVRLYEQSLAKDGQLINGIPEDKSAASIYAELGRLYYLTDQTTKSAAAIALVQRALTDEASRLDADEKKSIIGEGATTYGLWGEVFLEAGRFAEAAVMFKKAHDDKADAPLLAYRLARVAAGEKKTEEALKHLDEYFAAKTDASGSGPYDLYAKLIVPQVATPAVGQEQLVEKLQALSKDQPDNVPLAFALADALWTAGKLTEAVPLLTKSLTRQPDAERFAKLIEHHWQQKEYRELLTAAGQLADRSGSLDVIEDLMKKLAKDEALLRGCLALAREQAERKEPAPEPGPIFAAALLAREANQLKDADDLFAKVLALQPDKAVELRTQWALGLLLGDHPAEAAAAFQQVLAATPAPRNPSAIRYYLAGSLEMVGRTEEALTEIRAAAAANPGNPRFESRVGWILYHAKRYPEAAQEYERLLEKHGAKQQSEIREALRSAKLALSNIALEMDNFPQAVEWLEQVLDEYPEDPGALNDLGYLWAERGVHLQRALQMTQQAVAAEPDNKAYRDSLGWAYYRLGRYEEALKELEVATTGAPGDGPDGVLLDHLGDTLHKLGRQDEAIAAWKRAATAFEKEGETKKMKSVQDKLSR
jgi:tetratricopeptide (TPR) repeat protein